VSKRSKIKVNPRIEVFMMNRNDLNTDVRTQINPEDEVKAEPKSGYTQVKDLMDTVHGYCMDYTKMSFDFIHENKVL